MNVYKVNDHWIAAKDPESAFGHYLDETDSMDDIFIGDLEEGEEEVIQISVRRLTTEAMNVKVVPCCEDGCAECDGLNEQVYSSYQELIDGAKDFPCTLAKEL